MSEDQILAFVGGALDVAQRATLEAHLDACADCLELVALVGKTSLAQGGAPAGSEGAGAPLGGDRDDGTTDYDGLVTVAPQHYVVGAEIARGGMGRILAARDRRLGRPVAIKELLTASSELRARFEREARITAKLQHPSIVSVLEAGAWPDGAPFYVMKQVTGESLDKAIAGRATLDARLALLPNVLAAVDALAYAHTMRVIHRDLKPANVLVGEFGETVVIDWGFAKDLADSGAPELAAGPYRAASAAPGATLAGAVIGTPAYMPAEQARGEVVDERADVHALGAMLYHLLAGAPPYTGQTSALVLDAVIAGPPPPLATRAPGVPRELVTIVNKAMARDAAERYPTAKELADDLKKFQTGQLVGAHDYSTWQLVRRWTRRHRTPVAVAVVATMLLGALGVVSLRRIIREQDRTDAQRQQAEQSRGEAEDLLSFMLVDLREQLQPLGRVDLLDEVARKAIAYFQRGSTEMGDAELRRSALARRNLGEVLLIQGHLAEALEEHQAALAISKMLAAKDPSDARRSKELAIDHERVGDALTAHGDDVGALMEYRHALAISERLATNEPTNAEAQFHLAFDHQKVAGRVFALGDTAAALAELRTSLTIASSLVAQDPANTEWQSLLATAHAGIGDALGQQGDAAGALAESRTRLRVVGALVATDPGNAVRQWELASSHERVGSLLLSQGDAAGAAAEYREALQISEMLASKDPMNAEKQEALALAKMKVGNALIAQGNTDGALVQYRASLSIGEAMAAQRPTEARTQRVLSLNHTKIGDVLDARGDRTGALAEYRASLTIREALAMSAPTNVDWQQGLSVSQEKVGRLLLAQGDAPGALAVLRASLAIRQTLAVNDPTNGRRQRELSISHDKIGNVFLEQGNAAGALAEYQASLAIRESWHAKDSTNADWRRILALAHDSVGDAKMASNDPGGALNEYLAARVVREPLAKDSKASIWEADFAQNHQNVGDALAAQGDRARALAEYQSSLDLFQQLQSADPSNARFGEALTNVTTKVKTCCKTSR